MILTQRLIDASDAITAFRSITVPDYRQDLLSSVKSRAREVTRYRAGTELDASQVSYLQCLRSRLQDGCFDGSSVVAEWLDAFAEAYRAAPVVAVTLKGRDSNGEPITKAITVYPA